jgi:hypothetical protein
MYILRASIKLLAILVHRAIGNLVWTLISLTLKLLKAMVREKFSCIVDKNLTLPRGISFACLTTHWTAVSMRHQQHGHPYIHYCQSSGLYCHGCNELSQLKKAVGYRLIDFILRERRRLTQYQQIFVSEHATQRNLRAMKGSTQ